MNIRGFVHDIMTMAHEGVDLYGGDVRDACLRHGLAFERPLTIEEERDAKGPWHEYLLKAGDPWMFWSDELKAWLDDA